MNGRRPLMGVLGLACLASALAVVATQHRARQSLAELRELEGRRDALLVEWGRLQIEQSTWAAHPRVERIAAGRLEMAPPEPERVVVVSP
jgi:cell division protein FtsL